MNKYKNPIKVLECSEYNYEHIDILKNEYIANILLKDGIDYIENENNEMIKNDRYVNTLFFDYLDLDTNKTGIKINTEHHNGIKNEIIKKKNKSIVFNNKKKDYKKNTQNIKGFHIVNRNLLCNDKKKKRKYKFLKNYNKYEKTSCHKKINVKKKIDKYRIKKIKKSYKIKELLLRRLEESIICKYNYTQLSKRSKKYLFKLKNSYYFFCNYFRYKKKEKSFCLPNKNYTKLIIKKKNIPKRSSKFKIFFLKNKIFKNKKKKYIIPISKMNKDFLGLYYNEIKFSNYKYENKLFSKGNDELVNNNISKKFVYADNIAQPFHKINCMTCVEYEDNKFEEKFTNTNVEYCKNEKMKSLNDANNIDNNRNEININPYDVNEEYDNRNNILNQNEINLFFNEKNDEAKMLNNNYEDNNDINNFRRYKIKKGISFNSELKNGQMNSANNEYPNFIFRSEISNSNSKQVRDHEGNENIPSYDLLNKNKKREFHKFNKEIYFSKSVENESIHRATSSIIKSKRELYEDAIDVRRDVKKKDIEKEKKFSKKKNKKLRRNINDTKNSDTENLYMKCICTPEKKFDDFENNKKKIDKSNYSKREESIKSSNCIYNKYQEQFQKIVTPKIDCGNKNVYGFGETLKFMKYRELLRKYMGTFYNYSSFKCASYIILYALILKITAQISKNLTASSTTSESIDTNVKNTNIFLNIYDSEGIIQSICYIILLICIILLIKLGIPSNYLLAGRLTILFMLLFVIQIPIMVYANFLYLKNEGLQNKNNSKIYEKKDYFNLQLQKIFDAFYLDTFNLLIYTILIKLVSIYAAYHKLIYPHLLKFYLDRFFLNSYSIVKKEMIHFRVPNNIDAYYLNKMNSYLFNSLYKKQDQLSKEDLESSTRSAIGYNIVIKKERYSPFMKFFKKRVSNSPFKLRNRRNLNFCIIFYIGELDNKGRPHGFGYWRGINSEGEVLIGYWFHGIPVGPFKCRDFKTGSGFMCIKIGYGKTNCELNDLEIGLADTECCVSGAFYRTFPRVVFYNLNLTNVNRKNKKNENKHGLIEKRECCEYLIINKASNDILRFDYSNLLQDSDDDQINLDKNVANNNNEENKIDVLNNNSKIYNDELPKTLINDETYLKGEILNYNDIYRLSYDIEDFTLENEIQNALNKNVEKRDEEQKFNINKNKTKDLSSGICIKEKVHIIENSKEDVKDNEKYKEKIKRKEKDKEKNKEKYIKKIKRKEKDNETINEKNKGKDKEKNKTNKIRSNSEEHPSLIIGNNDNVTNENVIEKNKNKINSYKIPSNKKYNYEYKMNDDHCIEKKSEGRKKEKKYEFFNKEKKFNINTEIVLSKKSFQTIGKHKQELKKENDISDKNEEICLESLKKEKKGAKERYKMIANHFHLKDKKKKINKEDKNKDLIEGLSDNISVNENREYKKDTNEKEKNKKKKKNNKNSNFPRGEKAYRILRNIREKKKKKKDKKRKIKKKIGYSMTNTLLDLKNYNSLRIKKKNKKKNGNRKTFLPKAFSGTLPKLKIKKKRRGLLFSDTITNVYKTKCMNIILQNLCPHMPNFGIIYNTDLHISIDAERGLYITGYINKKNSNLLCSRSGNDFEDNEVKIKIIKKSKNSLNNKKGNEKRLYSWIDDIKELSLDGWVKCELAGCLEAVIFIHGYNTNHLEALQVLGQMASFGNFPNYIKLFLFNWPSGKNFLEFFIAKDNSKNKKVHHAFKSFLDTLRNNGIRQIHIITHSMGTRMFLLAFHDIVNSELFSTIDEKENSSKNVTKMKLITLTMMNPEYYLSDFVNKEYVFLRSFCTVISIYCDSNDKALKWAEIFSGTKSLGKNIFDLNICKDDYNSKNLNAYENFAFDSNKLEYYSIPVENRTDETEEISLDSKLFSSFFDSSKFQGKNDNEKMKNKEFMTKVVQRLRKIVNFFYKKKKNNNKLAKDDHSSMYNDNSFLNKENTKNVMHQPPMFRNTLLVFTGIEPTYCYRDNRDWLDVDVIDTTWLGSNVHTLRHSYWSLNREIIEDIRELIVTRKRARQRTSRLDRREGNVWVYRVAPSYLKSIFDSDL
ncbi:conserved Plasmodium protein, unknown function [Plasmodium relictum]|uniref:Uncharacterized protein n=1 Tax=Plasmodium relictum TaxID=85471 RepID=A0A1J1H1H9_PLARL|nr:conserved Plasmodium protein, unknown function [Plasmodium relictum]CRG98430.1 conserved Plasmodium protein, unknown function [Plasmodium relictum]